MENRVIKNIDEFNALFSQGTAHPLVSIGDLGKVDLRIFEPTDFQAYCVVLMDANFGELIKQDTCMRYRAGTMFTAKPGEVISMNLDPSVRPAGKMLVFREEMIRNTGLGRDFYMFNFFDYEVFEALELTDSERRIIVNCYSNINAELHSSKDELTDHMLRLGIGQLLSYCKRFYERQFDMRKLRSSDFIRRLDALLETYYSPGSDLPRELGYPTVGWCASQFNLSANYFGGIVRREMHLSAQEYIQDKIVSRAKTLLADPSLSVDEVSDRLGFSYPNHFTRLFGRRTGMSPSAFRKSLH